MGTLQRFIDAKGTVEGKVVAILVSIAMIFSLSGFSAYADDATGDSSSNAGQIEPAETATETNAPSGDETPVPEQPADNAAVNQPESSPVPEQPPVSEQAPESDTATVKLDLEHAYLMYLDQVVAAPATSLEVPFGKQFDFKAVADEGFEVSSVKTVVDGAETELTAEETGEYKVPADQVTSNLTIKVETEAVASESTTPESPSATPITSETVIANDENAGEGSAAEGEGATKPAEPIETIDVVADVSSPAYEGYAYVDNIIVKVTAGEGVLPEGTTVQASKVERDDVIDAVAETVESQGRVLQDAVAIDVTLLDKDGNAIQPEAPVNVCFFDANLEGDKIDVYHVADDASLVESVGTRQADASVQSFDVAHFSIYAVASSAGLQANQSYGDVNSWDGSIYGAQGLTVANNYATGTTTRLGTWTYEFAGSASISVKNLAEEFVADGKTSLEFDYATYDGTKIKWLQSSFSYSDRTYHLQCSANNSGNSGWVEVDSIDKLVFYYKGIREVPATGISISGASIVAAGGSTKLEAVLSPAGSTDVDKVIWNSSDSSIAAIDEHTGVVDGIEFGEVTITAAVNGYKANFKVSVVDLSLKLDKTSSTIMVGSTDTFKATSVPSGQDITWTSSNTNVATVRSGIVTAKGLGSAIITASMTVDGIKYSASATVNVVRNNQYDVVQNAYYYLWIPGAAEGGSYQDTWLYAGLGKIKAPTNMQSYTGNNKLTNLEGILTQPTYFEGKQIFYNGHVYSYDLSGKADYTFSVVWDNAIGSSGANDGHNWYGENHRNEIIYNPSPVANCWHVNGHVVLNTPEEVTVDFQVQQPGADGFETTGKPYPATVNKGMALSDLGVPNQQPTKNLDGITYNFDGWYYDQACTHRVDFANGSVTGHTVFYARCIAQFVQTVSVDGAVVDTQTVEQGGSWSSYTYSVPEGNHIVSVSINGIMQDVGDNPQSYTTDALGNVNASRTIEITTEADSYAVAYQFASDTAGRTLPAAVTGQLAQASVTSAYKYSTVANEFASESYESVEVTDPETGVLEGTWTFVPGWDASEAANVTDDVTFTGHWTFTEAAVPIPLPTPTETPTPTPTPAPTPTPGVLPADDPIAPVVDVLQNIAEAVIGENETPLANGGEETNIPDEETPLGTFDYVHCWVHYYLILGIILTLLYGAGVLIRRVRFTGKLKDYENDVLGIEDKPADESAAAPVATEGKEA